MIELPAMVEVRIAEIAVAVVAADRHHGECQRDALHPVLSRGFLLSDEGPFVNREARRHERDGRYDPSDGFFDQAPRREPEKRGDRRGTKARTDDEDAEQPRENR